MADVTVKRVDEFETAFGGGFCLARKSLGVKAFGMQVGRYPPNFDQYPEHDHAEDGQEEVYTALSGRAYLQVEGQEHVLEPGVFARVGPGQTRKIVTRDEPVEMLSIGGIPGAAYVPPAYTEGEGS